MQRGTIDCEVKGLEAGRRKVWPHPGIVQYLCLRLCGGEANKKERIRKRGLSQELNCVFSRKA